MAYRRDWKGEQPLACRETSFPGACQVIYIFQPRLESIGHTTNHSKGYALRVLATTVIAISCRIRQVQVGVVERHVKVCLASFD